MQQPLSITQCGCKGIRSCLLCEKSVINPPIPDSTENQNTCHVLSYCAQCQAGCLEADVDYPHPCHPRHPRQYPGTETLPFPGIAIIENFITEAEEHYLKNVIYETPFTKSQSGRLKQDYGPKVNFKKQKVKCDTFSGLPAFCKFLCERMTGTPGLRDFLPVELCNLEYDPERGSAIDPHLDDAWLWGERLVTLNLLADTVLRFTKDDLPGVEVHVPLSQRALVTVSGPARSEWKHAICRADIQRTRIAMTFRELSSEFQKDGKLESVGQNLVNLAMTFSGSAVGCQPRNSNVPEKQ